MKTKQTLEYSMVLHQQIVAYAKHHEIPISAVIRLALVEFTDRHKTATLVKPKPTSRDDELLPNGMTRAEQIADYERKEREWLAKKAQQAAQITERPRELSQTKALQDIVADWTD